MIFCRFSEVHEFVKPNDDQALNLLNSCAKAMLEEYPDIVYSYGFSDEYRYYSYFICLLHPITQFSLFLYPIHISLLIIISI